MGRKILYICDGCGKEHEDPPISLWMNRADANLKIKINGESPIVAIREDGLLNFCNTQCLQAYFSRLIEEKEA